MQRDNSIPFLKVSLRRRLTEALPASAFVLECYAGEGLCYDAVWHRFSRGATIDKDVEKIATAAKQRPSWLCFSGDTVRLLFHGLMAHRAADVVDIDCYGAPWATLEAWMRPDRVFAPVTHVFLTDGNRVHASISPPSKLLFPHLKGRADIPPDVYDAAVTRVLGEWSARCGLVVQDLHHTGQRSMTCYYLRLGIA